MYVNNIVIVCNTHIYVNTHTYMHTCTQTRMHTHIHILLHTYICTCAQKHTLYTCLQARKNQVWAGHCSLPSICSEEGRISSSPTSSKTEIETLKGKHSGTLHTVEPYIQWNLSLFILIVYVLIRIYSLLIYLCLHIIYLFIVGSLFLCLLVVHLVYLFVYLLFT